MICVLLPTGRRPHCTSYTACVAIIMGSVWPLSRVLHGQRYNFSIHPRKLSIYCWSFSPCQRSLTWLNRSSTAPVSRQFLSFYAVNKCQLSTPSSFPWPTCSTASPTRRIINRAPWLLGRVLGGYSGAWIGISAWTDCDTSHKRTSYQPLLLVLDTWYIYSNEK